MNKNNDLIRHWILAAIAAVSGLISPLHAQIWDASYAGDDLLNSPWSVANTDNVSTGLDTITFGTGTVSTYAQQLHSTPSSLWNPTGTGTYEVEFSISSYGTGLQSGGIAIGTGANYVPLYFNANGFDLAGYLGDGDDLSLNTVYTLRFEYTPTTGSVFLNNAPVAGLQNKTGFWSPNSLNATYVQRFAGPVGNDAVVTYSSFQWSNTSIVPEPAAACLLGLGLAFVFFRSNRKRCESA